MFRHRQLSLPWSECCACTRAHRATTPLRGGRSALVPSVRLATSKTRLESEPIVVN
jgi:hypothetical protein